MQFILHESLFDNPKNSMQIMGLLCLASKSYRHIVIPKNTSSPEFATWMQSLELHTRNSVDELLNSFYRRIANKVFLTSYLVTSVQQAKLGNGVSLDDAIALALRPFRIYVENSRNDRAFLMAFSSREQTDIFDGLVKSNAIEFVNGGGITELKAQIEDDISLGRTLKDYAWVIFDSDSLIPCSPSSQSKSLAACCIRLGLKYTQLKRRAIENYITKKALSQWVYSVRKRKNRYARSRRIEAYKTFITLAPEIANHYNMKYGICGDENRSDRIDNIYDDLKSNELTSLAVGFGSNVAEVYEKLWVTESDLRREGCWSEINNVIVQLERHL